LGHGIRSSSPWALNCFSVWWSKVAYLMESGEWVERERERKTERQRQTDRDSN
jgi:hypothetical protein